MTSENPSTSLSTGGIASSPISVISPVTQTGSAVSSPQILKVELGINGHPFVQASYKPGTGLSLDDQINLVKGLNAKWYRVPLNNLDQTLSVARLQGIKLLPVIMKAPTVLDTDSNDVVYQKCYDYALQTVTKYKNDIKVWEITNELDIVALLKKGDPTPLEYQKNGCNVGGIWNCGATSGINTYDYDETRYQRIKTIISGISNGIKQADSEAQRMVNFAGWLHVGFVQRLENDKVPYDILSVHWYSGQGEITCPGQTYPCPEKPTYFNVVTKLQQITNNKPMWMTEANYIYNAESTLDQDAQQSIYLSELLSRYKNNPDKYPFQVVFVYELLDEPYFGSTNSESFYGLFKMTTSASGQRILGPEKPICSSLRSIFAGQSFSSY